MPTFEEMLAEEQAREEEEQLSFNQMLDEENKREAKARPRLTRMTAAPQMSEVNKAKLPEGVRKFDEKWGSGTGNLAGGTLATMATLPARLLSRATKFISEKSGNPLNERGQAVVDFLDAQTEAAKPAQEGLAGGTGKVIGESVLTGPLQGKIMKGMDKINDAAGRASGRRLVERITSAGDKLDEAALEHIPGTMLPNAIQRATGRLGKATVGGAVEGAILADEGEGVQGALTGAALGGGLDALSRPVERFFKGMGNWNNEANQVKQYIKEHAPERDARIPILQGADDSWGSVIPKFATSFSSLLPNAKNRYHQRAIDLYDDLYAANARRILSNAGDSPQTKGRVENFMDMFNDSGDAKALGENMFLAKAQYKNAGRPGSLFTATDIGEPRGLNSRGEQEYSGLLRAMREGKLNLDPLSEEAPRFLSKKGQADYPESRFHEIVKFLELGKGTKSPSGGRYNINDMQDMYEQLSRMHSPGRSTNDLHGMRDNIVAAQKIFGKSPVANIAPSTTTFKGVDPTTQISRHARAGIVSSRRGQDFLHEGTNPLLGLDRSHDFEMRGSGVHSWLMEGTPNEQIPSWLREKTPRE